MPSFSHREGISLVGGKGDRKISWGQGEVKKLLDPRTAKEETLLPGLLGKGNFYTVCSGCRGRLLARVRVLRAA